MKKLALLISMILMVTIGGVYATWYYATNDVTDLTTVHFSLETTTATGGEKGTYSAEMKVDMLIDPAGTDAANRHKAALKFGSADEAGVVTPANPEDVAVVITYTPSGIVDANLAANGLLTKWSLKPGKAITDWEYNSTDIFSNINTTEHTIFPIDTDDATSLGNEWELVGGVFEYKITVGELQGMITLTDGIILDSNAKLGAFAEALNSSEIFLNVTDGVINGNTGA